MKHEQKQHAGMALILAIVAVLIISILISGIMLLSVSHLSLSAANSNYASALNLAEAGVNWELNKISHDPLSADTGWSAVQQRPDGKHTFMVKVVPYDPDDPNGPSDPNDPSLPVWRPPGAFWVYSVGTSDNVSRTIRVVARGHGLFGPEAPYAIFGIKTLDISGNFTVHGASGTNGTADIGGASTLNGSFALCGAAATGTVAPKVGPTQTLYPPLPMAFPTVNEVANQVAYSIYGIASTAGIGFFSTHNDNQSIMYVDKKTGERTASALTSTEVGDYFVGGSNAIVLGPGNYYFTDFNLNASDKIIIDNLTGAVNIWIGPEGPLTSPINKVNGTIDIVSTNPLYFNIYEGSGRQLQMNGDMNLYGNILAYNTTAAGVPYGNVQLNGNGMIWGSVIAYEVPKAQGDAVIDFPSTGGGGGGDPGSGDAILFYGFDRSWEELNPA